jgi:ribonuclease HI
MQNVRLGIWLFGEYLESEKVYNFRVVIPLHKKLCSITVNNTTKGRGELFIVMLIVKYCSNHINIYTNKEYPCLLLNRWIHRWNTNGYVTSTGGSVRNRDIITLLLQMGIQNVGVNHVNTCGVEILTAYNKLYDRCFKDGCDSFEGWSTVNAGCIDVKVATRNVNSKSNMNGKDRRP